MDTPEREPDPIRETPPPVSGTVHAVGWEWGRDADRQPRLPWIGIFVIVYGVLLLVANRFPAYLVASNLLAIAAGLAFLILWLLRRGTFSLYAGAFLTAASIPGLVAGAGYNSPEGLGKLCYGLAFLAIAGVRMTRGGGVGWQAVIGVLLVALGASEMALPDLTDILFPILLVVLGILLLTRDRSRASWRGPGN